MHRASGVAPPSPSYLEPFEVEDSTSDVEVFTPESVELKQSAKTDFPQTELNDLTRDLGLPKDAAELLGSKLSERNMLVPGTSFCCYRNREKDFIPHFADQDPVYCKDIPELVKMYKIEYDATEWRLFIDSSKRSLKAVLLHNGNQYASLPISHQKWMVCGDLKVISMLLLQQGGYTKYPCFLCEWDSRDKTQHYTRKEWPARAELIPEANNIMRESLVLREKFCCHLYTYNWE